LKNVVLIVIVAAACLTLIVASHFYWEQNIAAVVKEARAKMETTSKQDEMAHKAETVLARAKQLPAAAQHVMKQAVNENRPIRLVIAGSESTPEKGGWPDLFKQALDEAYGKGVFDITVHEYEGFTTADADEQRIAADWAEEQPDLVLLEPFLLNDNGVVTIDDSLEHIQAMIGQLKNAAPNAVVMLQPPNPIANATYYPQQVAALQAFAKENGYTYLDHWPAWPDDESDEFATFIDPDSDLPTKEGAKRWAEVLAKYFIAK